MVEQRPRQIARPGGGEGPPGTTGDGTPLDSDYDPWTANTVTVQPDIQETECHVRSPTLAAIYSKNRTGLLRLLKGEEMGMESFALSALLCRAVAGVYGRTTGRDPG
ncbi:hypothetical protein CGGC5_v003503 [Colletotrichum fructicola Nara gc5]|uniref:Uncharacterized protein n=1 Tax=Colletotrichum fructicola (strain Nara gc5) TaxID=1213859 RepID=A0A7J6JFM2_COLFN|nr:hypothetical protein CFRS1_v002010 [Colletotrichum fructicola]KAF4488493.1 hypothetical protein CGGC5_v003503 [Colletotrichum fructicola Nara gc5]